MNKDLSLEIQEWEESQYTFNLQRLYKSEKKYIDRRREKYKDHTRRHRGYGSHYNHETKWCRKHILRKFRRKMNRFILDETYYKPVPHEYKTYGWMTW